MSRQNSIIFNKKTEIFFDIQQISNLSNKYFFKGKKIDREKTEVFIKQIGGNLQEQSLPLNFIKEIAVLNEMQSIHIIKPFSKDIFFETDPSKPEFLISWCYELGIIDIKKSILTFQNKKNYLLKKKIIIKSILFQTLLGLDYLHQRGITHGNISSSNLILMNENSITPGILKIIGFSHCKLIDFFDGEKFFNSNINQFHAPEVLLGDNKCNFKIDIWNLGIIFLELLFEDLFNGFKFERYYQISKIVDLIGPFNQQDLFFNENYNDLYIKRFLQPSLNINNNLKSKISNLTNFESDFLFKLLKINPNERINANQALKHPYFNEIPLPVMNIVKLFNSE